MTEQKKDYIMDALGELEDSFIAEAAEYVKSKTTWQYWREVGAAAACVAAIVVTVGTMRYLPIGRSTETTAGARTENTSSINGRNDEAMPESVKEVVTAESAVAEGAVASTATTESVTNTTGVEELAGEKEINNGCQVICSQGIEWEIVEDEQNVSYQEQVKMEGWEVTDQQGESGGVQVDGQDQSKNTITSSCLTWLSAEEILAQGNDIFMGTVTELEVYHTTGKINKYFTVVTVEVTDSIRGTMQDGQECRIYLPLAEVNGTISTNSLMGDLEKLKVGSTAIFMPKTATSDTGLGKQDEGEWLCYADFADYYFSEGKRYLFLETEDGISYEEDVYEIPGENITLEDAAEYIRDMLANLERS